MNKYLFVLIFVVLGLTPGTAQEKMFQSMDSFQLTGPRDCRFQFTTAEDGTFRIEAPPTVKFEFSVASQTPDGQWVSQASSRNLKGEVENGLEATLKKGVTYLFIALPNPETPLPLVFTFKKARFSVLKNQLREELTQALPDHLPLKERLNWTEAAAIKRISAVWTKKGELLAGLQGPGGLQVWSLTQHSSLGPILVPGPRLQDFQLWIGEGSPLVAWQEGTAVPLKIRWWNGSGWIDQSLPQAFGPFRWASLPQGPVLLFRLATGALNAALWTPGGWKKLNGEPWSPSAGIGAEAGLDAVVFRETLTAGFLTTKDGDPVNRVARWDQGLVWNDTECPEVRPCGQQLMAASPDTLFTAQRLTGKGWSFYQFREPGGWQILERPDSLKDQEVTLCADGGNLWVTALDRQGLQLFQFDGIQWRAPLKLQALTEGLPTAVCFLDPPGGTQSHSLLILQSDGKTSTVQVFDLP